MYRIFSFLILCFYTHFAIAQEQLGVRLDAYSGMQAAQLNPSHSANLPLQWNLHLAGVGLSVDNSYVYAKNTNLLQMLANTDKIKLLTEYKNTPPPSDVIIIDFYKNYRKAFGNFELKINGPAIAFHRENHSGGLFYNVRAQLQAPRIPNGLNYYDVELLPYRELIKIPPASVRAMVWDEIGANYAYNFEINSGRIQIGANLKYLRGYEAFFAGSWNTLQLTRNSKDSVILGVPDASVGFTTGNLDNIKNETYKPQRQGNGIGMDLGATWLVSEYGDDNYQWRFGVALLDIGKIKFSPQAEYHYANEIHATGVLTRDDFKGIKTPIEAIRKYSKIVAGDSLETLYAKEFKIGLPMTLSLTAEYQFLPRAYVSAIFQQRIIQQDQALYRGNMLAVAARYQHRWFSTTVPVSLYNYQHLRLGVAARLGYLTLGTERLGSFFGKKNLTGTDFYMALAFNPFDINIPSLNIYPKERKPINCYKF